MRAAASTCSAGIQQVFATASGVWREQSSAKCVKTVVQEISPCGVAMTKRPSTAGSTP